MDGHRVRINFLTLRRVSLAVALSSVALVGCGDDGNSATPARPKTDRSTVSAPTVEATDVPDETTTTVQEELDSSVLPEGGTECSDTLGVTSEELSQLADGEVVQKGGVRDDTGGGYGFGPHAISECLWSMDGRPYGLLVWFPTPLGADERQGLGDVSQNPSYPDGFGPGAVEDVAPGQWTRLSCLAADQSVPDGTFFIQWSGTGAEADAVVKKVGETVCAAS